MCLSPRLMKLVEKKENGKWQTSFDIPDDTIDLLLKGRWKRGTPLSSADMKLLSLYGYTTVPCGKCLECRMQKSNDWANRCFMEMENHEHTYFVTLTYDDSYLPSFWTEEEIDEDTGEFKESEQIPTLDRKDVQLFLKRLRKRISPAKIRFFGCGEYGSNGARPHYHLLLFGFNPPSGDLTPFKRSRGSDGWYTVYRSHLLEAVWNKGYVSIAEANYQTVTYTARYIMKKQVQLDELREGQKLPFYMYSNRPGIGATWLQDHPYEDLVNEVSWETFYHSDALGVHSFSPPKYFKNKFKEQYPDLYEVLTTDLRDAYCSENKLILDQTDNDLLTINRIRDSKLDKLNKSYQRNRMD